MAAFLNRTNGQMATASERGCRTAGLKRPYFVDTTESRSRERRSDEQTAYFRITHQKAVELGKLAKEFTVPR
jgi:hypothetical protein